MQTIDLLTFSRDILVIYSHFRHILQSFSKRIERQGI